MLDGMRMAVVALALVACGRVDFDPSSECGPLDRAAGPYATRAEPFLLCTEAQLDAIGMHPEHWASAFRLGADIDLTATPPVIGTNESPFNGRFDGAGHTISHLAIDQPTVDGVGLFAHAGEGARFS